VDYRLARHFCPYNRRRFGQFSWRRYADRLGDPSMRPLSPLPHVIDYAHRRFRSPRMDVFLFATSRFVIGTTSGLTTAVQAFGTPLLVVNAISNDCQPWTANTHFLLKRIYDRRNKRFLTLREMISETLRPVLINRQPAATKWLWSLLEPSRRNQISRAVQTRPDNHAGRRTAEGRGSVIRFVR